MGALQLGAGGGRYASDLLHRTSMFERNDWHFTGGSLTLTLTLTSTRLQPNPSPNPNPNPNLHQAAA